MDENIGYNGAYTGSQIDAAIGAVRDKETTWDGKQDKLTGLQGQVVGFDDDGDAVAMPAPDTGVTTFNGRSGAVLPSEDDYSADMIKFSDGETFQQKYNAGELTGPQGIQGLKGDTGDTGPAGADGANGADATINGVNALTIEGGDNIETSQSGSTLTLNVTAVAKIDGSATLILDSSIQTSGENSITFDEEDDEPISASEVTFSVGSTGLSAANVQAAIVEVNNKAVPTKVAITIPTSGWTDNKQTFTVNGVPSDPLNHKVELASVGETNTAAMRDAGLYILNEAENSLTLAVSAVPTASFQVYAVITLLQ